MVRKKFLVYAFRLVSLLAVLSCSQIGSFFNSEIVQTNDIVILYTNDVHCGIESNIGYSGVAYYKQQMKEITPYVALVDCGDAIQGEAVGTISKGEYIRDIMNRVGYDFAIFGNHEFDYSATQLAKIVKTSKHQYLATNIRYWGVANPAFYYGSENEEGFLEPYAIKDFGGTKVAFLGVTTPYALTSSTPKYFQEKLSDTSMPCVFNFFSGSGTKSVNIDGGGPKDMNLYDIVQYYVDKVRKEGAKYVIVLSHLGLEDECAPDRGTDLIANTTGIDVVLDGHSHSTVPFELFENKKGKQVVYSQTGTKLQNLGRLIIKPNGKITTSLITDTFRSVSADSFVNNIKTSYASELGRKCFTSSAELPINYKVQGTDVRAVRNRETLIGDLCADAFRYVGDADIGLINGGGIRATLPAGDVTKQDILNTQPFGNTLVVVKAPGKVIMDMFEFAYRSVKAAPYKTATSNGTTVINADGELGGFQQVSGVTLTIDASTESPCQVSKSGFFEGIDTSKPRRVKNIQVFDRDDNTYKPIVENKPYTVASHSYLLVNQGDGFSMFDSKNGVKVVAEPNDPDYGVLIKYIEEQLNNNVTGYDSTLPPRITVMDGSTADTYTRI